ncbi:peptide chain release factor N(5)-glutamine methyltransferase [uncultured Bacteroides sp.]|uniref:peptide chain release factor N(5)-glutamine methyltransferase n=1 Tax=uncultured Bacteroides sp. TaxID=162156 RepID=UPI00262B1360|nr:peptide chain release factor N(5)-glutamine methyltransferase [uncultured Bacteroides sp.]
MHPSYQYINQSLAGLYPDEEIAAVAKCILTDVFHLSTLDLYTGKDMNFSRNDLDKLEDILLRLKRYEPLQYILGYAIFGGLTFSVTPDVLIPRPETEELIGWIVADHEKNSGLCVLDIGTGSGCIPITLARRLKGAEVASWDVSEKALEVARGNAVSNGVKVDFRRVDVLQKEHPDVRVDVLVSNPPYIAEKERKEMERNVLDWEPGLALFVPDEDPLLFYRRIGELGMEILKLGGCLYYEINRAYGPETVHLLEQLGYSRVELRKDLSGNDRMVKAVRL